MTLRSPKGSHTRPTASRTREAIWNSLLHKVYGANIIDFFCGSGAVGIEGLSRGAKSCRFIDNNRAALFSLKANLADLEFRAKRQGIEIEVSVNPTDACSVVATLSVNRYHIIWLDPPYEIVEPSFCQMWPGLRKALTEDGVCVVESDKDGAKALLAYLQDSGQGELLDKQKIYGKTVVSFIRKI